MRVAHILFLRNAVGFDLALAQDSLAADPNPASLPDWFHFGFRLSTRRAVRALHSRMASDGVQVDDIEDYGNYLTFRCQDPDGHSLEVYWS